MTRQLNFDFIVRLVDVKKSEVVNVLPPAANVQLNTIVFTTLVSLIYGCDWNRTLFTLLSALYKRVIETQINGFKWTDGVQGVV